MTRTSILSVDAYLSLFCDSLHLHANLKNAFKSPLLQEALAVASKDLFEANA